MTVRFHSLKLQTAEGTVFVPFDRPLSFPAAAAKLVEQNLGLEDPNMIYYLDNECRVPTEDKEHEALWFPNTNGKA